MGVALDLADPVKSPEAQIGGLSVHSTQVYRTGKYDIQNNWPGFPDEGIRYYFDSNRLNYLTIRPSGTSNALRFHLQLHAPSVDPENLVQEKARLWKLAKDVVADLRIQIGAKELDH